MAIIIARNNFLRKNFVEPTQKERQKLKERIRKEKDLDIKQESRKGLIVTILEDSFDY